MTQLRIGGVPEHFNLPWHLLLESGACESLGVEARWRDYSEGSGALAAALRSGELDVAMLLTEGAVAGLADAGGFKIVSVFTESPLLWGIHVPATSALQTVADLKHARYAISRRGSGSHLMAFVHARERGWPLASLELVVVRNLQGAVEAFAAGTADVFFWEKFMTQPLVASGRFRRVGEFAAPWPAFVVCASTAALERKGAALAALLPRVLDCAAELKRRRDGAALIAARYGLDRDDVTEWLRSTRWASRVGVERAALLPVVEALQQVDLLRPDFEAAEAIAPLR